MTALEDWRRLARRENRRAWYVWSAGVAPDDDVPTEHTVATSRDRHALAERWKPLFEAGLTPEQIAVREQASEITVWQALAIHLRAKHGMKRYALPPVFFQMRCARVIALREAGLARREIAATLGVKDGVIDTYLRRAGETDPGIASKMAPRHGLRRRYGRMTYDRGRTRDRPLARLKRRCANCGCVFQPTEKRRMLCRDCYLRDAPKWRHDDQENVVGTGERAGP